MNHQINRLLNFALQKGMIGTDDLYYAANLILDLLQLDEFELEEIDEKLETAQDIIDHILDYAVEKGMISDSVTEKDLFDTRLMNCLMPRASEVVNKFNTLYNESPEKATDYFYDLSISSNYIRKSRIDKNIMLNMVISRLLSTFLNQKRILKRLQLQKISNLQTILFAYCVKKTLDLQVI